MRSWTAKLIPGNMQFERKSIYHILEEHLSRFNKLDIRYNSLSMALDRQYVFDDMVNYSVSDYGKL